MNILITGARGMLGYDLIKVLSMGKEHQLFLCDLPDYDILQPIKIEKDFLKNVDIDIIIHAAAYTRVDRAELSKDYTTHINVIGTRNMALLAAKYDIPICYISTDYVFDGKKNEPYIEWDKPNPLSHYGKTKYYGEMEVANLTNKFYIIRTSWLFGENGNNFIKAIVKIARKNMNLRIVNDQFGAPTYTMDLAIAISIIISKHKYGVYHISNQGVTNWYEFAKYFLNKIPELKDTPVKPISSEEYEAPAIRPKYSVLRNTVLELDFKYALPSWQNALDSYLRKEYV